MHAAILEQDLLKLSLETLKEIHRHFYSDSSDEWFPVMYVTDECPFCKGEAHLLDNYQEDTMKLLCFNKSCEHYGQSVDRFYKQKDYYCFLLVVYLTHPDRAANPVGQGFV